MIFNLIFLKVQNNIHYGAHVQTVTDVIYAREDAPKEYMRLLSFKGEHPTLKEELIDKNYLNKKKLKSIS